THPLTGKRLQALAALAKQKGQGFALDFTTTIENMKVDRGRLWSGFLTGLGVMVLPWVVGLVSFLVLPGVVWVVPVLVAMLVSLLYRYPQGEAQKSTVLDEMRNLYASPVRGKRVELDGTVVGRGMPGYVFGEDVML